MKITIEIPDDQAKILGKWASVSRTMNEARRLLEDVFLSDLDDELHDAVSYCAEELRDLEPALNNLHALVRQEIWKQQS